MSGQIAVVVSQHLLDELTAVLTRPKFRRWLSAADAVSFVQSLGGTAELRPDPAAPARRVRDPNDDYLVALSESTGAVLVTGDADLLDANLTPAPTTPREIVDLLARTG